MKKFLGIVVLTFLLSGCSTFVDVGDYDGKIGSWSDSYITPTGGSITNHYMLGEPINALLQTANERCKRVHPNSKVINFRMVQKGKFFGSEYDVHKYECESVESKNQVQVLSMIDQAKLTCNSLGFEEGTEKFSDCSLKVYTQSLDLAAEKNQKVIMQGQSLGSNTVTIYDPVRDRDKAIRRAQGLINGKCTLADLSKCWFKFEGYHGITLGSFSDLGR